MTNFEIIDNGLHTMSQSSTISAHSLCAILAALLLLAIVICIICTIKKEYSLFEGVGLIILCTVMLISSIFTPFYLKKITTFQTYKAKPTENATVEDEIDFEMKYKIIAKEDGWYIVYEKQN